MAFAAIQCELGSVYMECGDSCEETCRNLGDDAAPYCNDTHCVEGCFCPPGSIRNGKHKSGYQPQTSGKIGMMH